MRLGPLSFALLLTAPAFAQDPIADTTAAWRYFPLEIGNVWEYRCLASECDPLVYNGTERRSIPSDTLVKGTRFFRYFVEHYLPGGEPTGEDVFLLRFDTLSATIEFEGARPADPIMTACPLDAPFNVMLDCGKLGALTYGGLSQVEIGGDVLTTTLKVYELHIDYWETFAANVGYLGWSSFGGLSLEYARVGGVEYGEPIVLSAEPSSPGLGLALVVYPNPSRGVTTLGLTVLAPQAVTVEVFDVLGRRVYHEAHVVSGTTSIPLGGRAWKPGVYVVRVTTVEGRSSTVRFARR